MSNSRACVTRERRLDIGPQQARKQGGERVSLSTVDCSLVLPSAVCGAGWGELWGLPNLDENSLLAVFKSLF